MVIDDDPTVPDLLRRALAKEGFQVESASSGGQGLEMAKRLRPRVITLDVMMPGLDGWAVLTALKADPATRDIVMDERAEEVVRKPDGKLGVKILGGVEKVKDQCKELKIGRCGQATN